MERGDVFYVCIHEKGNWSKTHYMPVRFRIDPVPSTGHYRNRVVNYYRRMRVTQEKRWAIAHKEYVRGRRRKPSLPDPWDEYLVSKERIKGWKRTKKKRQWM